MSIKHNFCFHNEKFVLALTGISFWWRWWEKAYFWSATVPIENHAKSRAWNKVTKWKHKSKKWKWTEFVKLFCKIWHNTVFPMQYHWRVRFKSKSNSAATLNSLLLLYFITSFKSGEKNDPTQSRCPLKVLQTLSRLSARLKV